MIKHQGEKRYSVSYIVHQKGEYIIFVKWGDDHIPGSPYRVVAWFKTWTARGSRSKMHFFAAFFTIIVTTQSCIKRVDDSCLYCCLTNHYFFPPSSYSLLLFFFYISFPLLKSTDWCVLLENHYVSLYNLIYTCQNLNWVKCLLSNKDINLYCYIADVHRLYWKKW